MVWGLRSETSNAASNRQNTEIHPRSVEEMKNESSSKQHSVGVGFAFREQADQQESPDSPAVSCLHDADIESDDDHLDLMKKDSSTADRYFRGDQQVPRNREFLDLG